MGNGMNERTKELAEQCGYRSNPDIYDRNQSFDIEKFAELVRADEREACAKLCDDWPNGKDYVYNIAQAIRARDIEQAEKQDGWVLREVYFSEGEPISHREPQWVGLRDEDLPEGETYDFDRGVRWAETKLKEKNHG